MSPSALFLLVVGLLQALLWTLLEAYANRRRIRRRVRSLRERAWRPHR
jgi:hypothetical protein